MWSLWKVLSNGWHNSKRSQKKQATQLRLNCRWAEEQEDPLVEHWVINTRKNAWCLGPKYLLSLLVLEETLSRQKTHVRKHSDYNFYLIWPGLNGEKNTAFCPKQLLYLMITSLLINIVLIMNLLITLYLTAQLKKIFKNSKCQAILVMHIFYSAIFWNAFFLNY